MVMKLEELLQSESVVCHKVKRRNDVIVFTKKDYDFSKDEILELFAKAIEQCKEKVLYVCRKCSFGLRGVHNNNAENVYSEMTKPSSHCVLHVIKCFTKENRFTCSGERIMILRIG